MKLYSANREKSRHILSMLQITLQDYFFDRRKRFSV